MCLPRLLLLFEVWTSIPTATFFVSSIHSDCKRIYSCPYLRFKSFNGCFKERGEEGVNEDLQCHPCARTIGFLEWILWLTFCRQIWSVWPTRAATSSWLFSMPLNWFKINKRLYCFPTSVTLLTIKYKGHLKYDHVICWWAIVHLAICEINKRINVLTDQARIVCFETIDHEFDKVHVQIGIARFVHVEKDHNRIVHVEFVQSFEMKCNELAHLLMRILILFVKFDDEMQDRIAVYVFIPHKHRTQLEKLVRKRKCIRF